LKTELIDRLSEELSLSDFPGTNVHTVDLLYKFNVLTVILQYFFRYEKEAVRVESVENWALRNHLGHEIVILEFHILWGVFSETVGI
jgi:hypothetical protein